MPFSGDILKTAAFRHDPGLSHLPLVGRRINAFYQHTPGLITAFSGILEGNSGVVAETEKLALAFKTVSHAPELAAVGRNEEEKTSAVEILVVFVGGLQIADTNIGKRHGHSLAVVGRRNTHMDKNIFDSEWLCM